MHFKPILVFFLNFISHWISTTQDNKVIYIITSMVDVENRRKAILVLKSRVSPVVQMFALAQDWFMVFPALVPLVIFTAKHVYSGNPGDRFSAQGVISCNKLAIYNWYEAVWVYMKHGVYNKQYSLAKRADNIGYYLVFKTYVGCFSSKSMVSTWIVSYLLVYTEYRIQNTLLTTVISTDHWWLEPIKTTQELDQLVNKLN